jgi:hypothetical protein
MKPPNPKSPSSHTAPPAAGETQVIDLQDVELLLGQADGLEAEQGGHERSLPPPLPPEVRASQLPAEPARGSQPPLSASHAPSFYPVPSHAPSPPRSTAFFVGAILAFLAVGVGGGVVFAMTRKAPSAAPAPTTKPQTAVITIPTVEVDDDPDSGK